MKSAIAALTVFAAGVSAAAATTVSAKLNVDNGFDIYISTDDALEGTTFGSGNNWRTTSTVSTTLTPGVVNYLHILAYDQGGPQALLGEFTLSDALFHFDNGGQTMLSGDAGLRVGTAGWGSYGATVSFGTNGQAGLPWTRSNTPRNTPIAGMPLTAEWVWAPGGTTSEPVGDGSRREFTYFSVAITPIPGPLGGLLLVSALGVAAAMRRR